MNTVEEKKLTTEERFAKQAQREKDIANANTQMIGIVQEIKKAHSRYQPTTTYHLEERLPQMMIHESDTHYGHLASDNDGWKYLYKFVMTTPGVFLGFYGDILEGYNPDHVDSNNQIILEPTEQILSFKDEFLKNLSFHNKIVHMIGLYTNSHLRAAVKKANIDPYPLLTHTLPIPLLYNGSIFSILYRKHSVALRGFHNPPSGGRSTNPTGGLDKAELEMSGYADHVIAGHLHTLGNAVAAMKTREGKIQYRYSLGARKGRNTGKALHDRFAVSTNGGKISGPPGAATLFYETPKGEREYGIGDVELAKILFRASGLYTQILDRGKEGEFRARILQELEQKPQIESVEAKSKKRIEDLDEQEVAGVTSWKKQFYSVKTEAPLLFMFASGLRLESKLANKRILKEVTELVAENPHAFLFVLRQMLDQDVPQHANREAVVAD